MSTKKNADITIFLLPPAIFTLNIYSIFLNSVLIADSLYDHHKYFYNCNIRKEINFHNNILQSNRKSVLGATEAKYG